MTRPYQICTKSVMDTSDPDIRFDEDGICHHYHDARRRLQLELMDNNVGRQKLFAIAEEIREAGRGLPYDCIMGVSGGADSSYVAVQAHELGLRPLAVHLDNGWNTDTACSNIERLVRHYGFDLYTHVVRWEEFRDIQRALFRASVANVEVATDHAIFALLYQMSEKFGVKYILTGSNLETETIMPDAWGYDARDARHIHAIKKQFGSPDIGLSSYPTMWPWSFAKHLLLRKVRMINVLNFGRYSKEQAVSRMNALFGYRSYARKHGESKFTRFFQEYYLPTKFNADKRRAHLSSQIASGTMSRAEALDILAKPLFDPVELEIHVDYVTKKLGFSAQEWDSIMQDSPRSFRDYPNFAMLFDHRNPVVLKIRDYAKGM
jgi:aminotransferase